MIERVERDDKRIKELEGLVADFLAEVAAKGRRPDGEIPAGGRLMPRAKPP